MDQQLLLGDVPDPAPVFCRKCGGKLVNKVTRDPAGYDAYTGKKKTLLTHVLACPKFNPNKPQSQKERKRYELHDAYVLGTEIVDAKNNE